MEKFKMESYDEAGMKPLGEGREKTIFVSPDDPEKIIGIFKEPAESAEEVRARFYLTKILHILYPQHIPDMHASISEPHAIEADRVHGEESTRKQNDVIKDRFFELGVKLDSKPANYVAEEGGPAQYVDTIRVWFRDGTPNYNPQKLREAIFKLDEGERSNALSYLARLEDLNGQYKNKNKRP